MNTPLINVNYLLIWLMNLLSVSFFLLNNSELAWGQARIKFGVVMPRHLRLVSLAFSVSFSCFMHFLELKVTKNG